MTTIINTQKLAGTSANPSVSGSFTAPSAGNTLLVSVAIPTANAPITAFTDNLGNTYTQDTVGTFGYGSLTIATYRCSNLANAPTTLSVTGTTGPFAAIFEVQEVSGLENVSPVEQAINAQFVGGASVDPHTWAYTTTNNNAFVFATIMTGNSRGLVSLTDGFVVWAGETTGNFHGASDADSGTAGAKSTTVDLSAGSAASVHAVIYKQAFSGPTVTSVTTPGTTEAGSMVFTASLSGATSGTTNYAFTLGGTATAGTDYTSPLTSAMCSNGVTVVGSDFVVPTAVSGWTVTIPTTSDTIDEADETIILTIGGTSGTGTITDDDAAPVISVGDAPSVTAGSPAVFTVTLDRAKSTSITVDAVCVDGTLVGGVGYTSNLASATISNGVTFGAGKFTIPAGVTSFTVSIATA